MTILWGGFLLAVIWWPTAVLGVQEARLHYFKLTTTLALLVAGWALWFMVIYAERAMIAADCGANEGCIAVAHWISDHAHLCGGIGLVLGVAALALLAMSRPKKQPSDAN